MSLTRIYQPTSLSLQTTLRLDERGSHHLARVLRASVGEDIILFNGQGGEYRASITHIDKKGVEVRVVDFSPRECESPVHIYLAQGLARGEKMDWIIQKAVELGVSGIIPLITSRTNVKLVGEREEKRVTHWQSVIVSACEQSGRNRLPTITPPILLPAWLAQVNADKRFLLSPHRTSHFSSTDGLPAGSSVALLIGPEGGLSEAEEALAINAQFLPLNLGPRILRTETAAIAAVSVLQFLSH